MSVGNQRIAGGVAMAGLVLALGACATVQNARDRIVRRPAACADQTVQIYFEPGAAEVTREGRAVLAAAHGEARTCRVRAVEVVGLSSATGSSAANLALSKARAQAVAATLASEGLPPAEFKVSAAGDDGAVTPDGKAQPLRRRVDVTLRLAQP